MLDLFITVIVPIFILVGIGFLVGKLSDFDLTSFSRLIFWVYTPAVLASVVLNTTIDAAEITQIVIFCVAIWAVTFGLGYGLYSFNKAGIDRIAMSFGTSFINGANLGLPLIILTFGEAGLAPHTVVIIAQTILIFTIGIVLIDPESTSIIRSAKQLVKVPAIWALVIAGIMKAFGVGLPEPISIPLDHLYGGYVALALVVLGIQLSQVQVGAQLGRVTPAIIVRLIISPLVAFGLVLLLGIDGLTAQVLILGAGLPTAVNTYILAIEYKRDPELASLLVFGSTLLSGITLPLLGSIVQKII